MSESPLPLFVAVPVEVLGGSLTDMFVEAYHLDSEGAYSVVDRSPFRVKRWSKFDANLPFLYFLLREILGRPPGITNPMRYVGARLYKIAIDCALHLEHFSGAPKCASNVAGLEKRIPTLDYVRAL